MTQSGSSWASWGMMLQDRTGKWRLAGMFLVSAAEMQKLDLMVQEMGVPALILMENAGRALAAHCEDLLKIMSPGDSLKQTESGQDVYKRQGFTRKAVVGFVSESHGVFKILIDCNTQLIYVTKGWKGRYP